MKERKITKLLCSIILLTLIILGCGKSYSTKFNASSEFTVGIATVAVLPFTDLTGGNGNSETISKFFAEELSRNFALQIIEGDDLKKKLSGKGISLEDLSGRAIAYKIAQILNVDAVVYGTILEYRYRKYSTKGGRISEDPVVSISTRILNGKSGTVVYAAADSRTNYSVFSAGKLPLVGLAAEISKDLVRAMRFNKK
jgi:polysaccharide biosynthesis protein PelC